MATHSSILAWRIPQTEEPGGLQSTLSQRVRHNWSDLARTHEKFFYYGGISLEESHLPLPDLRGMLFLLLVGPWNPQIQEPRPHPHLWSRP